MSDEIVGTDQKAKETGVPIPVRVRTTAMRVTRLGLVEMVANGSGKLVGYGIGKVANLLSEFASGFEIGMIAGRQPSHWQRRIIDQRAEEDIQTIIIEEGTVERKAQLD